ncbi:MAG: histidinol dehydrogenase [Rhodobacteraceae bacterium]|nr:type II toxin-antitoxin system VapB family antitoxin [Paracoccaceae bacterium]MDE2738513.1 type II toxin-antitoxin system VapB family antitoxin [Paracoccaceae bacterium]MYE37865.1 histidinol dehydrogenase [Paracoccaceae bacterium]
MPLYIRDETVNILAEKVVKTTGVKNKTEAVRQGLNSLLDAKKKEKSLLEHVYELQAQAKLIGEPDPNFDMKKFTDEMWDDS